MPPVRKAKDKSRSCSSGLDKVGETIQKIQTKPKEPVWKGPIDPGPQGGITFSLLSRYLACPERFRILTIEGLRPHDRFNHRLEFGNMWHVCEEELAKQGQGGDVGTVTENTRASLTSYCDKLETKYPFQRDEVDKWLNVVRTQFPLYIKHWAEHPDVKNRTPLEQEKVFRIPYKLPSGRMVYLRGKRDAVDLITVNGKPGVWLQEDKTKGDIDQRQMRRQLRFDLQTMLYLVGLHKEVENAGYGNIVKRYGPIMGVRYNVVRRPLSGGKGSIQPLQNVNRGKTVNGKPLPARPETPEEYYARLGETIANAYGPEWGLAPHENYFFMRWQVPVSVEDVNKFKVQCLTPVLENLCDDYEWWETCSRKGWNPYEFKIREMKFPDHYGRHFRQPYGIWNPLAEGATGDLDEFLDTGSMVGLGRVTDLFPELKGV